MFFTSFEKEIRLHSVDNSWVYSCVIHTNTLKNCPLYDFKTQIDAKLSRRTDYPGSKWLQQLKITGALLLRMFWLAVCRWDPWLENTDHQDVIFGDDEGWPSCHESVKPTIFFMTMAMMKDDQVIIRVSLRCQANNPLLPAQSFEDSLLLDIYCERTRYRANLFQHSLTLDNNPYQFSPLFHEHLHWELILTFSDKPEIQLTLGHGVNGSDIRFQFFFY